MRPPFPATAGSRHRREDYVFAIGKIRAQERFLIPQEVFEEALEEPLNETLRLFVESGLYPDELLHIKDSRGLEAVLNQETLKLKNLIGSLILDKELLGLLELNIIKCAEDILKTYPSEFLEDYLRYTMDMHNIKTYLRLYVLGQPREELNKHLTCEGFVKKKVLLEVYNQDLAILLTRLEYIHKPSSMLLNYSSFLKEAVFKIKGGNSFVHLEKAINDFLIQALKPAKYLSSGPLPLLAYYFAKINEINLIRMIILAKLNKVPGDLVKERLNSVYA
ncbi:MAG: V-type ATPase subunit [Candidatus Omnitrophica bacterium]|nr:V-type ATPase subunit [Candidatus Omnitrophota bacterium]